MKHRYEKSEQYLKRTLKSIPLGSQTFSKSHTQFPYGVSPYFIKQGKGSHVWDIDDNEYIDFVSGLLAISIGYQDPDVDDAVKKQLQNGVTFSLAHPLEAELAERIISLVPCAEMVRFGKNGSDVTSGAIRVARAYTGREHIAVCGYHGWQDWYIGSTSRDMGVPNSTKALTHRFKYNDIASLEEIFSTLHGKVAAVIMEPMNVEYPQNDFLQQVKELTHKNGALLIFDEMITGFRFALGGAQEYFNVVPDIATFGKGMANGYPLSAIAGKEKYMRLLEDIFFSFTFGGETLSLAASIAVLDKLQRENVLTKIAESGSLICDEINKLINKHELQKAIKTSGHPSWSFLLFQDVNGYSSNELKTLWMQEALKHGILTFGTHNVSYAHTKEDINYMIQVYDKIFGLLKQVVADKTLHEHLNCAVLQPLFRVR
ncbi:MAG: aminotransferase class III-fold pyridoxal phosphate-dependent enzyme [Gammaproteobacteria bacterium]|nr:aminotransferase class III-fold pyridoxal phosphate-dependent enzyme [Gammaproteobacteria bacterium]